MAFRAVPESPTVLVRWDLRARKLGSLRVVTHNTEKQSLPRPLQDSKRLRLPEFLDNRYLKVVRLSSLSTGKLYPPENIPLTHFCYRLSQPQGHSAAGKK